MNIVQIAKLLEISGFLLASIFAGILLEKGIIGNFADKWHSWLNSTYKSLNEIFPFPPRHKIITAVIIALTSLSVWAAVASIILGIVNGLNLLIILGSVLIFGFFSPAFQRLISRKLNKGDFTIGLLMLLVVIPMLIFTFAITALRQFIRLLAYKDLFKKAMLVFGSLLILLGLIFEFISTL